MLTVVNTQEFSTWRNLKNLAQGCAREETPSSGYAFYRDYTKVAEMTIFMAGNSQLNLGRDIFIFKRDGSGFFKQEWRLEGNGQCVATAKISPLGVSRCQISYNYHGLTRELTLRINSWSLRGNQFRVFEDERKIGGVERQSKGAIIDLPDEIFLPVQLFIFRLAKILWERGSD